MHWSERYVGMPYVPGENDCASFAARVLWEVFCQRVDIPSARATGLRGQTRQIAEHRDALAERVDTPREGDGVLMRGRGRLDHIGIYCDIDGQPFVLHAMRSAGQVCLHRLRDLPSLGFEVEGYYRWK